MARVYQFPDVQVSKQLFYVPGAAVEGGFTSGGVRMLSPEPGGRGYLDIQLSLRQEWNDPAASWLMSQTNGKVLRARLTMTPQLVTSKSLAVPQGGTLGYQEPMWKAPDIKRELQGRFISTALEGTTVVVIDMSPFGKVLKPGHLIGHAFDTYLVDDIEYDGNSASVTVTPPFRRRVSSGDACKFRPWFTGTMLSGSDFRTTYDAENAGMIQPGKITLAEAII